MQTCRQAQRPVPPSPPPPLPPLTRGEDKWRSRGGGDAAALRGRNQPVIVAEIRVQRVQIETHCHGGAHQLRDHLSKPKWGEELG